MITKKDLLILSFIVLGVLTRIIPHIDNFTAVYAIALFSGSVLRDRKIVALLIPIYIMGISDLILNTTINPSVYISLSFIVLFGFYFKKQKNIINIISYSITSSLIFFLITNFFVWINSTPMDGIYYCSKDVLGFTKCYIQAIPFFWPTLFSTIIYSLILFYSFELVKNLSIIKVK